MINYTDEESHNLHDKTVKTVLKHKEAFVELLTAFLPHLASKVDLEGLTLDTTNYLGSNFEEQFLDVAYRTTYKADAKRSFSLMFMTDHKRKINRATAVQMLSYICEVFKTDIAEKRELTTVVVVILDQGKSKKRRKSRLIDYFGDLPAELKKYIPDFEIELITIQGIDDEAILNLRKDNILRGMFLMFKHLGDDNFIRNNFSEFFTFVEQNPHLLDYLRLYYEYMSRHTEMEAEEFHDLADDYFESQSKSLAMTTYDKIVLKGMKEGIQKGMLEGKQQGKLEGKLEGIQERNTVLIRRALKKGLSIMEMSDLYDLTIEEVKTIIAKIEDEN
jgi:Putative transposase, YhgA-like